MSASRGFFQRLFSEHKEPPTPSKTLMDRPWRQPADWNKCLEGEIIADIKRLSPRTKPLLLFVGPVGAGKSSFINAALSIGKSRKVDSAQTGSTQKSYTTSESPQSQNTASPRSEEEERKREKYEKFREKTLLEKYSLGDCMGIEQLPDDGCHIDDIVMLLKGHIKEGYNFNPRSPITKDNREFYNASPVFENQTHCVIFVFNSEVIYAGISSAYMSKIVQLQEKIKQLRIPRLLILTKADKLCAEVEQDVSKMFWSVKVRKAVKKAAEVFGIPEACIHPVKNYEVDIVLNTMTNIPILLALRQMMQFAEDRVDSVLQDSP